jgi:hypothetical protein
MPVPLQETVVKSSHDAVIEYDECVNQNGNETTTRRDFGVQNNTPTAIGPMRSA